MLGRRNLLSGAVVGTLGLVGWRNLPRQSASWASGTLLCTSIQLNGGGVGQTPKVHITLIAADGITQVDIFRDAAEPFVERQSYSITAIQE